MKVYYINNEKMEIVSYSSNFFFTLSQENTYLQFLKENFKTKQIIAYPNFA